MFPDSKESIRISRRALLLVGHQASFAADALGPVSMTMPEIAVRMEDRILLAPPVRLQYRQRTIVTSEVAP